MDLSKILSLKRQGDKDKYGGGGEKKKSSGFAEASNILKSSSKRGMSKAAVHPLSEGKSSLQNHAAAAAADHEPETMSSMDAMIRSEGHTSKMRTGFTTEHVYAAKLIMETYRVLRYRENLINTAGDSANNNSNNGEEKV